MVHKKRLINKKRFLVILIAATFLLNYGIVTMSHGPNFTKNGFLLGNLVEIKGTYSAKLANPAMYVGQPNPNEKITVTIGLKWRNSQELSEALKEINDPHSANYHHYYTWKEFKENFAPSKTVYNALISWIEENGVHIKSTYPMRNAVTIYDTVGHIQKLFHTQFGVYRGDGVNLRSRYFAPSKPLCVPANLKPYIRGIDGITSAPIFHTDFWTTSTTDTSAQALYGTSAPTYVRGLTGADLFYTYGAVDLVNNSATGAASTQHILPTKIRVATVLWEGADSYGNQYAPFDPSNVIGYYQNVTPEWIQQILTTETGSNVSQIGWYSPDANAVAPGSNVDGYVNGENELDLEMVGTLAPGVNVTLVYGNGTYYNSTGSSGPGETDFPDQEYNYILNTLLPMTDRT
ncbi:MAG: peptidase S53, partial [Euryarchaeota archaeon]|nr:peptidase S53 [Euryarchaeota archaeon]